MANTKMVAMRFPIKELKIIDKARKGESRILYMLRKMGEVERIREALSSIHKHLEGQTSAVAASLRATAEYGLSEDSSGNGLEKEQSE
jgi:hypothetical protein